MVSDIFIQKYAIPVKLISSIEQTECPNIVAERNILELCITKKGELNILSSNQKMLTESLKIFKQL